jgi:hypothetical protein
MSLIANRPPGFNTRNASRNTAALQPFTELDRLRVACVYSVGACARQHLRRHVDTDEAPFAAELLCGEQCIEPGARPEINDDVTRLEIRDCRRVAATKAEVTGSCRSGQVRVGIPDLLRGIEFGGGAAASRPATARLLLRNARISVAHDRMCLCFFHGITP